MSIGSILLHLVLIIGGCFLGLLLAEWRYQRSVLLRRRAAHNEIVRKLQKRLDEMNGRMEG